MLVATGALQGMPARSTQFFHHKRDPHDTPRPSRTLYAHMPAPSWPVLVPWLPALFSRLLRSQQFTKHDNFSRNLHILVLTFFDTPFPSPEVFERDSC